jgi:hypothetical protein
VGCNRRFANRQSQRDTTPLFPFQKEDEARPTRPTKKTRSISGGPFFKVRKRSKNARRTTSSSSSRDSTTLGRARGRPLPGRPLDDAPPRPRLDDVGLSLSRISCVPSAADREMRCDAMRCVPTSPAEATTKRGHRNRSRAKRASLWSVWLSVFRRFTHFANDEDDSQSMRIPTDVCDVCDVCDENTSVYVLSRTRARARDRPSCVSFNVSSIHRTCAPLGERLENRPTSRRDL